MKNRVSLTVRYDGTGLRGLAMATSCNAGVGPHAPRVSRGRRAGMSLVEAMIAMVVIAIALIALLSMITSAGTVQDDSRQRTIAYNAARRKIEEMRALIYPKVIYDTYSYEIGRAHV